MDATVKIPTLVTAWLKDGSETFRFFVVEDRLVPAEHAGMAPRKVVTDFGQAIVGEAVEGTMFVQMQRPTRRSNWRITAGRVTLHEEQPVQVVRSKGRVYTLRIGPRNATFTL
jgi:hypothetical protein